jgi:transcriptional regulator with XRE-family HTH domain
MTPAELRALRERLGLTQAQLAGRLGTMQGRVSDWENERRPVPVQVAAHLRTLVELIECLDRNPTPGDGRSER